MSIESAAPAITPELARALPKAEVHLHLEGCFDLADLMLLARRNGATLPGPAASLFDLSTHTVELDPTSAAVTGMGVGRFLAFLDWEGSLVEDYETLRTLAYRACARESASGVRYADIIVNPTHWSPWGHRLDEFLRAICEGFDTAAGDGLCQAQLCVSLLRQQDTDSALEVVDTMVRSRLPRVVALSVDGDESQAGDSNSRLAPAFDRARAEGLRRTVHTGESSGPDSVWAAIDMLHADRIDHGVRAIEDPRLVETLVARGIGLGICPRSNVAGTHLYGSLAEHPIDRLRRAGVTVSINTDDPGPMGVRIEDEYADCAQTFGWDLATVAEVAAASVRASFAPADLAAGILADIATFADALDPDSHPVSAPY